MMYKGYEITEDVNTFDVNIDDTIIMFGSLNDATTFIDELELYDDKD